MLKHQSTLRGMFILLLKDEIFVRLVGMCADGLREQITVNKRESRVLWKDMHGELSLRTENGKNTVGDTMRYGNQ